MNNFEMHMLDSLSSSICKQNFSTAELEAINTEKFRKWSFESLDSNCRNYRLFKKMQQTSITILSVFSSAYSWNTAFSVKHF